MGSRREKINRQYSNITMSSLVTFGSLWGWMLLLNVRNYIEHLINIKQNIFESKYIYCLSANLLLSTVTMETLFWRHPNSAAMCNTFLSHLLVCVLLYTPNPTFINTMACFADITGFWWIISILRIYQSMAWPVYLYWPIFRDFGQIGRKLKNDVII